MDIIKRVQMLQVSIARTMERLDVMEHALDKADSEVANLSSQHMFLTATIRRLKKPGIAVSMEEYFKIKVQILHTEDKKSRILFEVVRVNAAMSAAEKRLEIETAELSRLEPMIGVVIPFRRKR